MKKRSSGIAGLTLLGSAILFSSCGGDNTNEAPDETSIETEETQNNGDMDDDISQDTIPMEVTRDTTAV